MDIGCFFYAAADECIHVKDIKAIDVFLLCVFDKSESHKCRELIYFNNL